MTDKKPDQPNEEAEAFDAEGDLTVLLPEEMAAADGPTEGLTEGMTEALTDQLDATETVDDAIDVTETVPTQVGSDDVFVLLPDEEGAIPMVETEAIDVTEQMAPSPTATQVGLRASNPTETDLLDATEECLIAEEPTDPVGDLDGLATQVADDLMLDDDEDAPFDEDYFHDDLESELADEPEQSSRKKPARRGGGGAWKALVSMAALAAIAAAGLYFFPDKLGLDPFNRIAVASSRTEKPARVIPAKTPPKQTGSEKTPAVDADALAAASEEAFRAKFSLAIKTAFAGEVNK